jgi:hypothetical protein
MQVRRALTWFLLALIVTPFVWGAFGAIFAVLSTRRDENLAGIFLLNLSMLPLFAGVVVLMLSPLYAALISLWLFIVRAKPALEAGRGRLAVACVFLAVPGAFVVGSSYANVVGTFEWREFSFAFPLALASGWSGLLLPRLVLKSLAPGTFAPADPQHAA